MKPWYKVDSAPVRKADAAESAFVEQTLKFVAAQLEETLIPPLKGMRFVHMDTSPGVGAKTYAYRQITRTGIAQLIGDRGEDVPNADIFVQEFIHKFYRLGEGYEYTWDELLAAEFSAQNGGPPINIDFEKARAAKEAIAKGFDRIASTGSASGMGADVGIVGLANHPNATIYTIANGASGSPLWTAKTPDEVLADLYGIAAAQVAGTYEVHQPTKYLLPTLQHRSIVGRSMGDGRSETILSYFMRTQQAAGIPIDVESWQPLATAGTGSTTRMIAYEPNSRYVRHPVSDLFTQLPPERRALVFKVLCIAKSAGVVMPHPLSCSYADGF